MWGIHLVHLVSSGVPLPASTHPATAANTRHLGGEMKPNHVRRVINDEYERPLGGGGELRTRPDSHGCPEQHLCTARSLDRGQGRHTRRRPSGVRPRTTPFDGENCGLSSSCENGVGGPGTTTETGGPRGQVETLVWMIVQAEVPERVDATDQVGVLRPDLAACRRTPPRRGRARTSSSSSTDPSDELRPLHVVRQLPTESVHPSETTDPSTDAVRSAGAEGDSAPENTVICSITHADTPSAFRARTR